MNYSYKDVATRLSWVKYKDNPHGYIYYYELDFKSLINFEKLENIAEIICRNKNNNDNELKVLFLKKLIDEGLNVNKLNENNKPLLYYSARTNNLLITSVLIEHGADINQVKNYPKSLAFCLSTEIGKSVYEKDIILNDIKNIKTIKTNTFKL